MRLIFTLIFSGLSLVSLAQADSSVLSFESFISLVKNHHPVALQAEIKAEMGLANLRSARGNFDPKLQADLAQKYFEDKEYYDLGEGKLKIPTWFGIELEGGYERNEGQFLNPENTVPASGLWFAGISVPVGEGLFIDERRASLRKAQAMVKQNEAERDALLNELLMNAGYAYWDWFNAYYNLKIYEEALVVTQQRLDAVKLGAELGDRPDIDTLEAGIQQQNRELNLQQAQLEYRNATAFLSIYLWQEGVIPVELNDSVVPADKSVIESEINGSQPNLQRDSFLINHPELRKSLAKIQQLEIERRWRREQLKPTLNLKYKPITEADEENPFSEYSINNYTWGFQFEFPIFLRKERGKLNLVQLKLNDNTLALENKRQTIAAKVEMAFNELETTRKQIGIYTKTTQDYKGLLEGERTLFDGGESSLFMVNSREMGFINAQLKLVELLAKNKKAILKARYALGSLNKIN